MDAVGASTAQRSIEVRLSLVVDGGVIAEFLQALACFFSSARYAYGAATFDLDRKSVV